jgi:hypothetical protein
MTDPAEILVDIVVFGVSSVAKTNLPGRHLTHELRPLCCKLASAGNMCSFVFPPGSLLLSDKWCGHLSETDIVTTGQWLMAGINDMIKSGRKKLQLFFWIGTCELWMIFALSLENNLTERHLLLWCRRWGELQGPSSFLRGLVVFFSRNRAASSASFGVLLHSNYKLEDISHRAASTSYVFQLVLALGLIPRYRTSHVVAYRMIELDDIDPGRTIMKLASRYSTRLAETNERLLK